MSRELFPLPSPPPADARLVQPFPDAGVTANTSQKLVEILKDNHEKWHCFWNKEDFHNHATHHATALWALGANEQALQKGYDRDKHFQVEAIKSPEEITKANWRQHLGEERFYKAYLDFFTKVVQEQGPSSAIIDYIFAFDSNFEHPAMLSRLMGAAFHPLITLGSGLEFGMHGLVAEGLAQAAVHKSESGDLLTPVFFKHCYEDVGITGGEKSQHATFSSRLDTLMHKLRAKPRQQQKDVHALTILSRVLKDEKLSGVKETGFYDIYSNVAEKHHEALSDYAGQLTMNLKLGAAVQNKKEIEEKLEELAWAYSVMYGLSGWKRHQDFNADFFMAHIVASAIFLPSILHKLEAPNQVLLLRAHFASALTWWVGRGRPNVDIAEFMSSSKELPTNPTNPFLDIVQSAIVNEESHVSEVQRTLRHWARMYGRKGANDPKLSATELKDADKLDGTLFTRVAELTKIRTSRQKEAMHEEDVMNLVFQTWDRSGYYERPQTTLGS
ncbi:hypothetical protein APHAL10511_008531 [Amanita phalloides]|nr:hypothetical protein APHAL10511_008531 [Amanita phalloides]